MTAGSKIIEGLRAAQAGDFTSVRIGDVTWVRQSEIRDAEDVASNLAYERSALMLNMSNANVEGAGYRHLLDSAANAIRALKSSPT